MVSSVGGSLKAGVLEDGLQRHAIDVLLWCHIVVAPNRWPIIEELGLKAE
jgi:hypothetical protein